MTIAANLATSRRATAGARAALVLATLMVVEHWDVITPIPAELPHGNGPF